ncbi:transcription antitermination factor NusB [Schaalia sp. Marseille-Q2122]|uniref:transcription antitermination factor NusB n=1 Tax=Schaalia sp. Marseille-Q2122 TaxID=2736604 RepID=UPI00158EC896|nr:transcription antitermination factor NusB [Schaalia sp. Marseille-Q2122]
MATHRYADGYRALKDIDPARMVAYTVLEQVNEEGAYANLVLPKALRQAREDYRGFDARDAAFASELVYGTLRHQGTWDWVIARHLSRPLADIDPPVRNLLRLGVHQMLAMRVPDHAAIASTVDLARHLVTEGPSKMVNAVLRSIQRSGEDALRDAMAELPHDERLAIEYAHPEWMVRAFRDALEGHGYNAGELEELLSADNVAPIVTLVARPGLIHPADLADEAEDILHTRVAPGDVSEVAVLIESGDPALLPSVRQGLAGAQDEGSQLAAFVAAAAPLEGSDERWLDLCAGPGGKATLLAAIGAERGATLLANEMHSHRARLVERASRALDNVTVISGDGRTLGGPNTSYPLASYDRVIVDVPCTGMGSMRRRPESRWRKDAENLAELLPLQRDLLERACALTRPGGIITYVTCSPHLAETRDQVEALLDAGEVELLDTVQIAQECAPLPLDIPQDAGRVKGGGEGRTLQLWQHRHGTDLMFMAAFRKKP